MKYKNQQNKNCKAYPARSGGFTLIEMVIYIALFSVMMGGLIVTVYQLYQSAGSTTAKITVQEETNFVLKKIDWALTGSSINTPLSGTSAILSVTKTGFSSNPIVIRFNSASSSLEYCTGACATSHYFFPLTSANVKVTGLQFNYDSTTRIATASTTINGTPATITKYLR